MFTVIELQNGAIGGNYWTYETKPRAETKMYQVLAEVVESDVATHTVMLVDEQGTVHDCRCYVHKANEGEGGDA